MYDENTGPWTYHQFSDYGSGGGKGGREWPHPFPLAIPEKGSRQNHPCSYYWMKCMMKRDPGVLPSGTTAEFRSTCSLLIVDSLFNTWKAFFDILQTLSKSAAQPALCMWWLGSHGGITQHPTFSKSSSLSSFHWVPLTLVLFRNLGLWFKSYPLLLPWLFLDFKFCGSHRKFQMPWLNLQSLPVLWASVLGSLCHADS